MVSPAAMWLHPLRGAVNWATDHPVQYPRFTKQRNGKPERGPQYGFRGPQALLSSQAPPSVKIKYICVCIIEIIFYDCTGIKMNILWVISVLIPVQSKYGTCLLQEVKHIHGPLKVSWAWGTVPTASQRKENVTQWSNGRVRSLPLLTPVPKPISLFFLSTTSDGVHPLQQAACAHLSVTHCG